MSSNVPSTGGGAGAGSATTATNNNNMSHHLYHHHYHLAHLNHLNHHHTAEYLEELMEKYAQVLNSNTTSSSVGGAGETTTVVSSLNQKLEEIRNHMRNELYKQYKLQEGAEKMRTATTDKKRLPQLNAMIKESNAKIEELNQDLADLNSFIVVTQSETTVVLDPFNNRNSKCWLISSK